MTSHRITAATRRGYSALGMLITMACIVVLLVSLLNATNRDNRHTLHGRQNTCSSNDSYPWWPR